LACFTRLYNHEELAKPADRQTGKPKSGQNLPASLFRETGAHQALRERANGDRSDGFPKL
jgi:hypothetical protein